MHNKLNGQISPKNSSDLVNVQSGVHPIPLNLSCFVLYSLFMQRRYVSQLTSNSKHQKQDLQEQCYR